jgi:hypothetical protein
MEELIKELKIALDNKLYITAINTALIIPDICSALQSENGETKGSKYENWFNKYVSDKYYNMLNGNDVWKLRCASLHQGTLNKGYKSFEKIIFQIPTNNGFFVHCNMLNNCLSLDIDTFVNDILNGYKSWILDMENNENYKSNINSSFKYHSKGLSPYINIPIIA